MGRGMRDPAGCRPPPGADLGQLLSSRREVARRSVAKRYSCVADCIILLYGKPP